MSDSELAHFLLSLVVLLVAALAAGQLFDWLKLPRAVGEIAAGFVLGPSVLGAILPDLSNWLFRGFAAQSALLSVFYWLGLVLLMFIAGFKVEPRLEPAERKLVGGLVVGSTLLPFALGWWSAPLVAGPNPGAPFAIVMGIAAAVTSIPVISRIFLDLGMMGTPFAKLVLAGAAIQDLLLWTVLAMALALQKQQTADFGSLASVAAVTLAFAGISIIAGPSLLRMAGRLAARSLTEAALTGYTLVVCLLFATGASILGVNIIFGALIAGMTIGRFPDSRFRDVKQRISDLAIWFFVPIYFALVGQRIDVHSHFDLLLCIGFVFATSAVKVASCLVATWFIRVPWSRAVDLAFAMNTRGGPGIVLASVAFEARIIDEPLFVALVFASIATSLFAGLWFRYRLAHGVDFGAPAA